MLESTYLYVSKHLLHEANPGKTSYFVGFSLVDMAGKPKVFQQAAVALLLGLFSTRKWILSNIKERLIFADIRAVQLSNNDGRGGVWHRNNGKEDEDVSSDIILKFTQNEFWTK